MAIKINQLKKRDSIIETMTLPLSASLKQRYERIKNELIKRDLESIHILTRERIGLMLDEIEQQLEVG